MRKLSVLHSPVWGRHFVFLVAVILLERTGITLVSPFSLWALNAVVFSCLSREVPKIQGPTETGASGDLCTWGWGGRKSNKEISVFPMVPVTPGHFSKN